MCYPSFANPSARQSLVLLLSLAITTALTVSSLSHILAGMIFGSDSVGDEVKEQRCAYEAAFVAEKSTHHEDV